MPTYFRTIFRIALFVCLLLFFIVIPKLFKLCFKRKAMSAQEIETQCDQLILMMSIIVLLYSFGNVGTDFAIGLLSASQIFTRTIINSLPMTFGFITVSKIKSNAKRDR